MLNQLAQRRLAVFGSGPSVTAVRAEPQSGVAIPAWAVTATILLIVTSVAVAVAAALTRGPWIDEFWTLWATEPGLSWTDELRQRWLTDVHPPGFYAASRLFAIVLGDDIATRRLQNLLPLAALLGWFVYAARIWRGGARFLSIYAVLTFSSYFATGYFAEYRSYFAQFACGIMCFGCACMLLGTSPITVPRDRARLLAIMAAASVLLVNLHFVTALITAFALGGLMLTAYAFGERKLSVAFCAIGIVSALPLVATLAFQAGYLVQRASGHFWIDTGLLQSVVIVVGSLVKGIGVDAVAVAAALRALARPRRWSGRDGMLGVSLVATAALTLVCLLVINLSTPIIVDRYLVLCSAAAIAGISLLAAGEIFTYRWGFPLLLANAMLFVVFAGGKLIGEPRWNAAAAVVRAHLDECPQSLVTALAFPLPGELPNEPRVSAAAFDYLARRYGFEAQLKQGLTAQARQNDCPRIIWMDNVPWYRWATGVGTQNVLDAVHRALGAAAAPNPVILPTKTGAVLLDRAD